MMRLILFSRSVADFWFGFATEFSSNCPLANWLKICSIEACFTEYVWIWSAFLLFSKAPNILPMLIAVVILNLKKFWKCSIC